MTRRLVHLTTTDMSVDWLLRPQLEAFRDAGYEVIAMSAPGPHVEALEGSGIAHHPIPSLTRTMSPIRDIRAIIELHRAFKKLRPNIVHTHNPKAGVFGRIAARVAGVPVIVNTVHGLYALPEDSLVKRGVVYGLERMAASCSHHELLQNLEDLPVMRRLGVPEDRLTVLGNGIDLDRFDPSAVPAGTRERVRDEWGVSDTTLVIGAVGRLVREKGYETLFAAAAAMTAAGRDVAFTVCGPDDPDKPDALDAETRRLAETAGVRFLGRCDEMTDVYRGFDVYVLASHREGFPRSAMEASAMGLPVVATDIRGCRQVVDDDVTGHLFPVGDTDALVELLNRLDDDPIRRGRMGAAARSRALHEFDHRDVISTTLDLYDRLVDSEMSPTPPNDQLPTFDTSTAAR